MTGDYQPRRKTKRPERRTKEEQENIDRAKALLMERNHMTEPEAHHYLQRCAMDSGTKIAETAEMILLLAGPV
jgi:response regulator NasT